MVFLHVVLAAALGAPLAPVSLPSGEPRSDWARALSLVELEVGEAHDGAAVWLRPGVRWTIRVRDDAGQIRELDVATPRTQEDRERVAFLAASLLQPMVEVPLPALAPEPALRRRRPARPTRDGLVVAPVPLAPLPPPTVWRPGVARPWVPAGRTWGSEPRSPGAWWGALGLAVSVRAGVRPAGGLAAWIGWRGPEPWEAVGGVTVGLPARLAPVAEARTMQSVRGWLAGRITRGAWSVDAGPGVSWRRFTEGGTPVAQPWIVDGHVGLGRWIDVGPLTVRIRAELTVDVVPVDLVVVDGSRRRLSPLGGGLGVTAGIRQTAARAGRMRR